MTNRVIGGIELALGFGLSRTVISSAYATSFGGGAEPSVGFVSSTGFALAANVLGVLWVLASIWLSLRGASGARQGADDRTTLGHPLLLVTYAASLVLALGFVLGATGALAVLPGPASFALRTVLYAVGSASLTLAWFVPFARMAEASLAVRCVIAGYLAQAALYLGMSFLGGWAGFVACILSLALSCALMGDALRRGTFSTASVDGGSDRTAAYRQRCRSLRSALIPLISSFTCVFILTIVVSLMHTSVIGNELEPVLGAVPMAEAHALATAIFVPVMALRRRVPDTTLVYRVLFPVMLVALSLLPFVSEALGTLSGLAMVVCYDIVGIAFVLLLVEVSQARRDVPPAALIGVYQVGTEASVAVGLVLGLGINRLGAHASEASYVTILMLACIYLLSTVLMVLLRRRGSVLVAAGPDGDAVLSDRSLRRTRGGDGAGAPPVDGAAVGEPAARDDAARAAWPDGEAGTSGLDGTADGVRVSAHPTPGEHAEQQSVREQVSARVELFAREKGLTPREAQVLVQLARGRSAPALAADLGITENTAWAHIKRIYMKLDVHGRQELIDLVEREVISPAGDEG